MIQQPEGETVACEFVGGQLDGHIMAIALNEEGLPCETILTLESYVGAQGDEGTWVDGKWYDDDMPESHPMRIRHQSIARGAMFRHATYKRRPGMNPDGPAWMFTLDRITDSSEEEVEDE